MARIVSLLPSTTETAVALGLEGDLVGRSHECDIPASVRALPAVTAPKLNIEARSAEIDSQVKQLVREGLSVYRVDAELLRELKPDVILTQTQCEVCAATPEDLDDALQDWIGNRPRVVAVEPNTLDDVLDDIERIGAGCGVPERGHELRTQVRVAIYQISHAAGLSGAAPRVACLEWLDPAMGCGNWIPELIERAGGRSVAGQTGQHAKWTSVAALAELDPDIVLLSPCGFDLARTRAELPALQAQPGWSELGAVQNGRVFLLDGFAHMTRPGPRIAESLELLAEILHPGQFEYGRRGGGWEPL